MEGPRPPVYPPWPARGTKRTRSQMETSDRNVHGRTRSSSSADRGVRSSSSTTATSRTEESQRRSHSLLREAVQERVAGMGGNMSTSRGPATASPAISDVQVIDLTGDEPVTAPAARLDTVFGQARRGPRYHQQIIDLSDDTPPQEDGGSAAEDNDSTAPMGGRTEESPEVQYIRERRLPPRPASPRRRFGGTNTPPVGLNSPIFLSRDGPIEIPDDDDLEIVEERQFGGQGLGRPDVGIGGVLMSAFGRLSRDLGVIARPFAGLPTTAQHQRGMRIAVTRGSPAIHFVPAGTRIPMAMPDQMDFMSAAFDLGLDDPDRHRREESVIVAPDAAPEGFTRSPGDDEVLVCPNCDGELGLGDEETKRQVWVIKGCGHVYCGECTSQRLRKPKAVSKGKQKAKTAVIDNGLPKPFKECVIEGCRKKATAKQMLQLFL